VTTVASLDRMIRARHLLKHPFYTAWSKGELPLDTLGRYAEQYYRFESNFPRYVAATYARIPNPRLRRPLLENLVDEEGRDPTHPELWLDFAAALGRSPGHVTRARPLPATRALLRTYDRAAFARSPAAGLGALYAYESIFPEVAAEKSRGLREEYGITDPKAHEFFRVHTVADVEHSGAERAVMRAVLRDRPADGRAMELHCARSIDAWWRFLDAFVPSGTAGSN
jgi:pyrroloquinoline-quinone synthase